MRESKFSSEVRARAVQLVLEQVAQHKSQWQAISSIAPKFDCHAGTLGCVKSLGVEFEVDGCVMPLSGVG